MDTLRDARRMQDEYSHSKGQCNLNCIICDAECETCEGDGMNPNNQLIDGSYKCPDCNGTGKRQAKQ